MWEQEEQQYHILEEEMDGAFANFEVGGVKRPVLSVGALNWSGIPVHFDKENSMFE